MNRATTFFRLLTVIPIAIVITAVAGSSSDDSGQYATAGAGGLVFLAPLLMIVFRQKYPRWWFD